MFLPDSVKRIIELLQKSSFKAYAVGGCVRDAIMGRQINDYDITTSALPEQVEAVLRDNGIKYIETGLKHGTVTAIIEHIPYEITTFRKDGDYLDNRHPEKVLFVNDIKDDLSRRDFTINAIAYNEQEGFIDLFGGREDIKYKLIKSVGNADERFNEDALRIMRALRFASQLSFEIEDETKRSIFRNKELLKKIAVERILIELKKLLLVNILNDYKEVISVIIPELNGELIGAIEYTPKKDYIRLALLLSDTENAEDILKRLRVSNEITDKATTLIDNSKTDMENNSVCIKKLLNEIGEKLFFDLIDYKKAQYVYLKKDITELDDIKKEAKRIIESNEPYSVKDLAINGFDLMELGFKGKEISDMLNYLISEVIRHPEYNSKQKLIEITNHEPRITNKKAGKRALDIGI